MLMSSGHYERVDFNVGMSGFLNKGDTPWYFPCKRPPPMSVHHYVSPRIFCGHLQLVKMTLGLLTTTVATVYSLPFGQAVKQTSLLPTTQ